MTKVQRILDEGPITFGELAQQINDGPTRRTLMNWAELGSHCGNGRRVYLETIWIGERRRTSLAAYHRFLEKLNQCRDEE